MFCSRHVDIYTNGPEIDKRSTLSHTVHSVPWVAFGIAITAIKPMLDRSLLTVAASESPAENWIQPRSPCLPQCGTAAT